MPRTWRRCTSDSPASSQLDDSRSEKHVNINRKILSNFDKKLSPKTAPYQFEPTNLIDNYRQFKSGIHLPRCEPFVNRAWHRPTCRPQIACKAHHRYQIPLPPATRRRRIRLRASTNLRGRAASRSAIAQAPRRALRSLSEPTVHPTALANYCR